MTPRISAAASSSPRRVFATALGVVTLFAGLHMVRAVAHLAVRARHDDGRDPLVAVAGEHAPVLDDSSSGCACTAMSVNDFAILLHSGGRSGPASGGARSVRRRLLASCPQAIDEGVRSDETVIGSHLRAVICAGQRYCTRDCTHARDSGFAFGRAHGGHGANSGAATIAAPARWVATTARARAASSRQVRPRAAQPKIRTRTARSKAGPCPVTAPTTPPPKTRAKPTKRSTPKTSGTVNSDTRATQRYGHRRTLDVRAGCTDTRHLAIATYFATPRGSSRIRRLRLRRNLQVGGVA